MREFVGRSLVDPGVLDAPEAVAQQVEEDRVGGTTDLGIDDCVHTDVRRRVEVDRRTAAAAHVDDSDDVCLLAHGRGIFEVDG